jgi:hypothetical protein
MGIGTVKTAFKLRVGRCSPVEDAFPAKIALWDRDLIQNGRYSSIEVLLY